MAGQTKDRQSEKLYERIPKQFRSVDDDYYKSDWSRGHMSPAGDNKHSQQAMNETFLLSNIVPQDFDNNGVFGSPLEQYCRDLTHRFSHVLIITGPLMLFNNQTENKKHPTVTYQLIGQNEVPTQLCKHIETQRNGHLDNELRWSNDILVFSCYSSLFHDVRKRTNTKLRTYFTTCKDSLLPMCIFILSIFCLLCV